jgi:hypothetical protein
MPNVLAPNSAPDPRREHPIGIVFRLLMEHVMQPYQDSTGGVPLSHQTAWIGCRDRLCRPFFVEQDRDAAGRLICSFCSSGHASDRALRNHQRDVHGLKPRRSRREIGPVACDCGSILAHRNSYIKHINRGRCSVHYPHALRRFKVRKRSGELRARRVARKGGR